MVLWWPPHSLSGAYLQDYASYAYEISSVDKSHQGRVQYTGIITLACLILPNSLSGAYIQDYASYAYKFHGWIDLIKAECSTQES